MTWTVINDPIPAGATILGSGLGRDSVIAQGAHERRYSAGSVPSYIERSAEAYRAYFAYLPVGTHYLEYTVRLNTSGVFNLPATRAEALYEPDAFALVPNTPFTIEP